MHDGLLRISLPKEASLATFADDIAIVVTGKTDLFLRLVDKEAI